MRVLQNAWSDHSDKEEKQTQPECTDVWGHSSEKQRPQSHDGKRSREYPTKVPEIPPRWLLVIANRVQTLFSNSYRCLEPSAPFCKQDGSREQGCPFLYVQSIDRRL